MSNSDAVTTGRDLIVVSTMELVKAGNVLAGTTPFVRTTALLALR
jgi:hypothetical protein